MAIGPLVTARAFSLLAMCLIGNPILASAQTATDKVIATSPQKTDKTVPIQPHRPPRVISDLAQFHLDRQPGQNTQPQTGAGSRGSAPTALLLCAPVSGISASTRPLFQWKIPDGNPSQVTFTLLNAAGDVVYENDVTGTSLVYPVEAPPLLRGQSYSWKVSGGGINSLPEPVSVEVQSKPGFDAVQTQAATGDAATDPLTRAQVYLQNHIWYDTVSSLEKSISELPGRSDLKQQLAALYKQVAPACAAR